jgi:hypothetical protein
MSDRAAFLDRYFAFTAAGYDDASATGYAMSTAYQAPPPLPVTAMTEDQRTALAQVLGPRAWADRILADVRRVRVAPEATAPVSAPVSAASPSPSAAAGILAMAPDDRLAYAARIGNDAFTRQLSEELRTTKVGGG